MKIIYRCFLTINSIILLAAVYLIKEGVHIPIKYLSFPHVSYFVYVFAPIVMSGFCIWLSRFLGDDIISGGVLDVECANDASLPSYLGYFFVALSINDWDTLIWVGVLLLIFTFFSRTSYFNPLFLLFGYKFYYVTVKGKIKFSIISRGDIFKIEGLAFEKLKRINNYTFIDREID